MNPQQPKPAASPKLDPKIPPKPKWWGKYVENQKATGHRFVVLWHRIAAVAGAFLLVCYLALATALWGYYSAYRKIPDVHWLDIAVLPRFSHVQKAIADNYLAKAKDAWAAKDYMTAIFTARASLQKVPSNLEARLFLARCWLEAGRKQEGMRVLHGGITYNASDPRLQEAVFSAYMASERYPEILKMLHDEFPAHGVNLLDGRNWVYSLMEVRATLEASGASEASNLVTRHPELNERPEAAPLLARIDKELGHGRAALDRLIAARRKVPQDPGIIETYARIANSIGEFAEAKAAARTYVSLYPRQVSAELCAIEIFGSRKGDDLKPWVFDTMLFLKLHRKDPGATSQLASLAAAKGWTDICYLLYENSLQENMTGLPFGIFYAASLVKVGDFAGADAVWHDLALRNSSQIAYASYVQAMIAKGTGRDAEAEEIVASLSRETANDPVRRRTMVSMFRDFGFPKIADELGSGGKT